MSHVYEELILPLSLLAAGLPILIAYITHYGQPDFFVCYTCSHVH